ncbi:MAG TPA: hypothetical protein DEO84_07170, partial [candidate division Zixibacteria bacterium]|nr:hypothetical protein [candidate division Zixibacteria bacterium]
MVVLMLVFLLAGAVSHADVIVKSKSIVDMGGMMSSQSDGVDNIKGDKSYNSMTTRMTGGMAAMFNKGKPKEMVTITRLDKGLFWNLDPERKSYKETTLEEMKKQFADVK